MTELREKIARALYMTWEGFPVERAEEVFSGAAAGHPVFVTIVEDFYEGADAVLAILKEPGEGVAQALVAMERAFGRDEGYHYTREQIAAVGLARRALCEHFDVKPATEPSAKVPRQTHG